MSNSDTKTWALVLVLGLAGLWQITRSIMPSNAKTVAERERAMELAQGDRDFEPYSVPPTKSAPVRPVPRATPAAQTLPVAQSLSPEELARLQASAAHVGEVADKKKDEKCEPTRDPKTGKVTPCKTKKKKKKKTAEKKTEDTAAQNPKTTTKPVDTDSKGIEWNVGAAVQTGQLNGPINKQDDPYDSLQAWEARLLASPDLAATRQFIDHFQRNLVSSEIFYRITQQMLDDSRADMKLLGVMCAAVNMSTTSFSMLARFTEKERSGTSPRAQADTALNRYADIGSLSILASVMRNTSDYPTYVAIQKLDTSIQRNLTTTTPTTPAPQPATDPTKTDGSGTAGATTPANTVQTKNRAQYTRFVTILQGLAKSTDSQIKGQASQTLATLQGKLGTTSSTPTAPTTPVANGPGTPVGQPAS